MLKWFRSVLIPPRPRPLGCDRLLCVLGLTNLPQFVQQAGAPLDLDWNVTACFLPLLLPLPLRLDAAADRSRRRLVACPAFYRYEITATPHPPPPSFLPSFLPSRVPLPKLFPAVWRLGELTTCAVECHRARQAWPRGRCPCCTSTSAAR